MAFTRLSALCAQFSTSRWSRSFQVFQKELGVVLGMNSSDMYVQDIEQTCGLFYCANASRGMSAVRCYNRDTDDVRCPRNLADVYALPESVTHVYETRCGVFATAGPWDFQTKYEALTQARESEGLSMPACVRCLLKFHSCAGIT